MRDGVLVVSTTPPGAQVTLDGQPVPGTTPLVVEGVRLSGPHRVEASAPGHRAASVEVAGEPGRLTRSVHLALSSAHRLLHGGERCPPAPRCASTEGVGRTPLTVSGVRVDERHRVDLTLPGHDVDQFVVLPEKDGDRIVRKLSPRPRGPG